MEPVPTTEKKSIARCGIWEDRPQICRDYPKVDHYMPEECTYTFNGEERRGECACDVGACCNAPRENGEPGGTPLPSIAGGRPCKHLVWKEVDVPMEKSASHPALPILQNSLYDLVGGPSDP